LSHDRSNEKAAPDLNYIDPLSLFMKPGLSSKELGELVQPSGLSSLTVADLGRPSVFKPQRA